MNIEKYIMLKHKIGENLLVRFIYFPINKIKEFYVSHVLYSKEDRKKILSLKNMYQGKRCFVVGNGPSLTAEDLEYIKDEISFASNRIYNVFNQTSWRPNFYVCVDPIQLCENRKEILELKDSNKFISCRSDLQDEKTIRINDRRVYIVNPYKDYSVNFSENVEKLVYTHSTVLYTILQIAIYMGFSEIILLGVDHKYKIMTDSNNKLITDNDVKKNHFTAQKESNDNIVYDANGANHDYYAVKRVAEKKNISVLNATRGGYLEIFERCSLEEIIGVK